MSQNQGNGQWYEDPDNYGAIQDNLFDLVNDIWDLVDRGEGGTQQNGAQRPQTTQTMDLTPVYIAGAVIGFLLLLLIAVVLFKN